MNMVVVSGPSGAGKDYVLGSIISGGDVVTGSDATRRARLELDNKYYTCSLDIWLAEREDAGSVQSTLGEHGRDCQALVLVFDSGDAASFDTLLAWEGFMEETSPSVLLVVGNERRAGSVDAALEERARDWALDHGLEYVSVPFASAAVAVGVSQAGKAEETVEDGAEDTDENEGLPRILAALESNMWRHMEMKARSGAGSRSGGNSERTVVDKSSSSNMVVVSGPSGAGKEYVLGSIISGGDVVTGSDATRRARLELDNKYYTCSLDIWLAERKETDSAQSILGEHGRDCQALVLVFDSGDAASFDTLLAWEGFMEETSPSVLLVVGNERRAGSVDAALEERARDWALDHGLEYVSVPFASAAAVGGVGQAEEAEQAVGGEEDDDEGLPRILAALEANTWRHMNMKANLGAGAGGDGGNEDDAASDSSGVGEDDAEAPNISESTSNDGMRTDTTLVVGEFVEVFGLERAAHYNGCLGRVIKVLSDGKLGLEIAFQGKSKNLSLNSDKVRAVMKPPANTDVDPSEEDMEHEVESFSALMERAQRIREMGSGLPDDERRRQAEGALREILSMEGLNIEDM
jgi:hypothetical protein